MCRWEQEDVREDAGYMDEVEEEQYEEEDAESLETIAEQGESQCTPMTEHSTTNHLSSFNAHDATEPAQHRTVLEAVKSPLEAVSSQLTAITTRDKAYWVNRLAALGDSGEQFAFSMAGKGKIRYKSRAPRKSIGAQQLSISAPVGPIQQLGSLSAPHTPAHTPGVSIDMEDSNHFNYFVNPPLDEQSSEETHESTQELSGSTSQHLLANLDSSRRQEGSGAHHLINRSPYLLAYCTDARAHSLKVLGIHSIIPSQHDWLASHA